MVFPEFCEGLARCVLRRIRQPRAVVVLGSHILLPQAAPRGSSNRVKRNNIAVFYNPSSQSNDCVSSKYFTGVTDERFISYVFSPTEITSMSAFNLQTGLTPL